MPLPPSPAPAAGDPGPPGTPQRLPRLHVLVVDDDPLARTALTAQLRAAGLVVIAEAACGRDAVELAVHYRPDVVVMDAELPGMDGAQTTRRLLDRAPGLRVVLLATARDDELALDGLRAGAVGFLEKATDLDALPRALAGVVAGEAAISRRLTLRVMEQLRDARLTTQGLRPVRSSLSGREWEVLDLLCRGLGTDELAELLVLSPETIRTHVKSITRKLGVRTRAEAVDAAVRLREQDVREQDVRGEPAMAGAPA